MALGPAWPSGGSSGTTPTGPGTGISDTATAVRLAITDSTQTFNSNGTTVGTFNANGLELSSGDQQLYIRNGVGDSNPLRIYRNGSGSYIYGNSQAITFYQDAASNINFQCDDAGGGDILFLTRGANEVGRFNAAGLALLKDGSDANPNFVAGAGSDLKIWHDGSNSHIQAVGTSLLFSTTAFQLYFDVPSGQYTAFRHDGTEVGRFNDHGLALARDGSTGAPNLEFGASNDCRLFHDGSNTFIQSITGGLYLTTNSGSNLVIQNSAAGGGDILFHTRGSNEVGRFGANGLLCLVDAGSTSTPNIAVGAGSDLRMLHDGTNSYLFNATGQFYFLQNANANFFIRAANASGGDIIFQTRGTTEVGRFDSTGLRIPIDNGTSLRLGAGNDLTLGHDGSNSFLTNNVGQMSIFQDAAADLFLRTDDASTGNIVFQTRGGNTRCSINNQNGINLNSDAVANISNSNQLCSEAGTDGLIFVSSQGTKYRVDLTAV